ncbi:hypothetical protein LIER_03015 [Lithospermum erythrorhizon]|uniref:Uncharacterized protein n=1 Tax=Lithospermum erythrorhizon TaxID=34254 RepID=A0AAV3NRL6_LITER
MPGVDPAVTVNRLYVDLHFKPIKYKKRTFSEEKGEAIREELLAWPVAGNVLQLYLAVSEFTLSSFLIREESKVQRPVYPVSRVIRGAKTRNNKADPESMVVEWVEEEDFRTKKDHIRKCNSCQRLANIPCQRPHEMVSMLCPILLDQWGVDIVGDLLTTVGSKIYVIVAVD